MPPGQPLSSRSLGMLHCNIPVAARRVAGGNGGRGNDFILLSQWLTVAARRYFQGLTAMDKPLK